MKIFIQLLFLVLLSSQAGASGLSPNVYELKLDERTRAAALTVFNTTDTDITVRLSLVDRQMQANGELKLPEQNPPAWSALRMLRFSPRQTVIPARGQQTVRVLYRRAPDLAEGQYRSHLQVHNVPDTGLDHGEASVSRPGPGIGARLNIVSGFSIPIFVNNGALASQAELVAVQYQPGPDQTPQLGFDVAVQGNALSQIKLQLVRGALGAAGDVLYESGWVVLYPELSRREILAPLPPTLQVGEPAWARMLHSPSKAISSAAVSWEPRIAPGPTP